MLRCPKAAMAIISKSIRAARPIIKRQSSKSSVGATHVACSEEQFAAVETPSADLRRTPHGSAAAGRGPEMLPVNRKPAGQVEVDAVDGCFQSGPVFDSHREQTSALGSRSVGHQF